MAKEYVIYEKDGQQSAHTDNYTPRDGEEEVGRVEADSAEKALRKFKRSGSDDSDADDESGEDEGYDHALTRREPSEDEKKKELERARKEEESKEDFEVMADGKGNFYVEGEESDPAKAKGGKKAAKAPEPPAEAEPSSVGTFRARNAEEALKMAKGEYKQPAEGPQRGAQTP